VKNISKGRYKRRKKNEKKGKEKHSKEKIQIGWKKAPSNVL
jgi:nucleoid DNA-binding protein